MDQASPRQPDLELVQLGERLKKTREYLGMSQQYVAHNTGIPRTAVSDIERGNRRVDSLELKKLARLYSLPVSYFLDEQEQADAGEHALAGLPRALAGLTDGDKAEILRYAEYLKFKRIAEQSDQNDER
ncbi:helix-turn-helix transcriptional regulator [Plantactinospora sp. KLBMP9567]|uniref:helix-turn-helix domain-containing protein n=1 Tax=Plantactinospora sp. KLBMP9567 TaxID=3085900 RepID=UPI00298168BB|nr:helix-turn-helix transcriptional regulator [Plantactinospora sp. KLBMP9567]MDW5327191.1 helix-turn-helix transcriptional regulator [Plantactinospora sp. KLBMP9567]